MTIITATVITIYLLLPIAWIAGTYYICNWLGINEVTKRKREAIFNARNEFKNKK